MPRAKATKRAAKLPAGAKLTVIRSAAGPEIHVENVAPGDVRVVVDWLDRVFRALGVPVPAPDTVMGGTPIDVRDDEWADEGKRKKRVGF